MAHLLPTGVRLMVGAPASRAAWSWECTYYAGGSSASPVYMPVNASDGPTCVDGSKLRCECPETPCDGARAAVPHDLVCAGAGDDALNDGCFKLHQAYGQGPAALLAVAGRGPKAGRGTALMADSCKEEAGIVKVLGDEKGLAMMVGWNALPASKAETATIADAAECQAKCAEDSACEFFTFNDQSLSGGKYYFRGLCFLLEALSCDGDAYSHHHGAVSGPKTCPVPTTPVVANAPRGARAAALAAAVAVAAGASADARSR